MLNAADAKSVVQQMLAREWLRRDRLSLKLGPPHAAIEPGTLVETEVAPFSWQVEKCTLDAFVSSVELRPSWQPTVALVAGAGRILASSDVVAGPMTLALIQVADEPESGEPRTLGIAASRRGPNWHAGRLSVTIGSDTFAVRTAPRKSVLGHATSVLGEDGCVEVELIDDEQWLTSCEKAALAAGTNLALLGQEIVQFAEATPLGGGKFRLCQLVRGLHGTASAEHGPGETFCLLTAATIRTIRVPAWLSGADICVEDGFGSRVRGKIKCRPADKSR